MPTETSEENEVRQVNLTLSPNTLRRLDALKDDIARTRSAVVARLVDDANRRAKATS